MLIHSDSKESNLSHQERSAFIRRDWEERGRTVSSFKRREESENCLRTKTKRLIEQRRSIEQVSKQTGPSDSVRSEQRHTPDADKLTRTTCSRSACNSNLFLAGFVQLHRGNLSRAFFRPSFYVKFSISRKIIILLVRCYLPFISRLLLRSRIFRGQIKWLKMRRRMYLEDLIIS